MTLEGLILGVFACAPMLPYAQKLLERPVPRFVLQGDFAGLETATRFVPAGKTLLGPYSRFGFNHPGPLYFFLSSPAYEASGRTPTGLFLGALLVSALAIVATVVAMRVFATRAHALAAAFVFVAWLAAFGDLTPVPWNPVTVALPLVAFLVLAAFVASGEARAAPAAALFAALAAQTHVSVVPTVTGVSVAALASFYVVTRRHGEAREAGRRSSRTALAIAAGVLVVTSAPFLLEQVTASEGNLTKLARFFAAAKADTPSLATAATRWMNGTSPMWPRIYEGTVASEGWELFMMGSKVVPDTLDRTATIMSVVWIGAIALAAAASHRRRDVTSFAIACAALLGAALAILSLSRVVGESMRYLLFWTTSTAVVGWMAVATSLFRAAAQVVERASFRGRATASVAAGLALVACVYGATAQQRTWLATTPIVYDPIPNFERAYSALLARVRETGETPVLHADGAWAFALFALNELPRDGIAPAVDERQRYVLGRQFIGASEAARPLHVYASMTGHTQPREPCHEVLFEAPDLEIRVSGRAPCP